MTITIGSLRTRVVRAWLPGDPPNSDPQAGVDDWSMRLHTGMYEGLYRVAANGRVAPALATGVRMSADGRTADIAIRPGATWSDGRPVTAHDAVTAAERALDPANALRAAWQWYVIEGGRERHQGQSDVPLGIEALSPGTLRLRLAEPLPYLPELLTLPALAPLRADLPGITRPPAPWDPSGPVTGPWRLAAAHPGEVYRFEPNPRHWDDTLPGTNVEYLIGGDPVARFEADEIDLAPVGQEHAGADTAHPHVHLAAESTAVSLVLNTTYTGLREQAQRDAIAAAVDRTDFVRRACPSALPLRRMVPRSPGSAAYLSAHAHRGRTPDPDPAALAGRPFELICGDRPEQVREAAVLAEQIATGTGCAIQVTPLPYTPLYQRVRRSEHQLALVAWRADFDHPLAFLREHTSDGAAGNQSKWSDDVYDRLVAKARRSADDGERHALLAAAEQRVLAYRGVIPLCSRRRPWLIRPGLERVVFRATGVSPELRWATR